MLNGVSGHVKKARWSPSSVLPVRARRSLLSVLSARLDKSSNIAGEVLFQGKERNPATWKRLTGFVEQDDLMFARSHCARDAAVLARPSTAQTPVQTSKNASNVSKTAIAMLRLEKCRDTRIGGPNQRGVSGG